MVYCLRLKYLGYGKAERMINKIAPHKADMVFRRETPCGNDHVLFIKDNETLLKISGDGRREIPRFSDFPDEGEDLKESAYYMFSIDDEGYYLVTEMRQREDKNFGFFPGNTFRGMKPKYQAFAGITATQIARFLDGRKFCGKCGAKTVLSTSERAVICPACGRIEYPKISPAVITAVCSGDRLLMSRYRPSPDHGYRHYALIAGYVEVGETLEDTVRREVFEEVGLKVKNIRYYKSQPWAFSDSEMAGFFAELDVDDTITLEDDELSEAGWFTREEIEDETDMSSIGSELKMVLKYGSLEEFIRKTGYTDD